MKILDIDINEFPDIESLYKVFYEIGQDKEASPNGAHLSSYKIDAVRNMMYQKKEF